ncbi:hypothetical protein BW722_05205 [Lawsonia intracellularis]|uniref:hemolysin family protein n=1 Tax=Lawsonia intracellularis TaxID=29546 RepID=UPI0009760FFF|nr:CNNM domain-containing protein [Lawsonia intracellularis]OMQ02855.1 hypothetical protein BW722_05205 [Lawsonia intracellularis]
MIILLGTVFLIVLISALCSMMEAAIYSIPITYIEHLREQGSKKGEKLYYLHSNIDQPITAVLILNTIANTAGAALAGAIATTTLHESTMPFFAAILTLLILAFGEIIPKTLGVAYSKRIAIILLNPLCILIVTLKPLIMLSSYLTRLVSPRKRPTVTEDDIRALTSLSRESGRIKPYEEHVIKNILSLDLKYAHEIMTPRTMVFSLHENLTVSEAYSNPKIWNYSRIPIYGENNEDITGIIQRYEIGRYMTNGETEKKLLEIMQPAKFVLESQTVDHLLLAFLEERQHLFIVLDEYGGLSGVVSLEDVLETMLGREIVDESDTTPDLRALAKKRHSALIQNNKNTLLK